MVQLPKSTIVLAIATCIPFGLAIRDTVAGKYQANPDRDYDDEEVDRVVAERLEVENQRATAEEARQEIVRARSNARIETLYSTEVAMLGSAFKSIQLGDPVGKTTVESSGDIELMLLDDGVATHTLNVHPRDRDDGDCEALDQRLSQTWGQPWFDVGSVWVNPLAQQRAVWSSGKCELSFERIAPIETWLDNSRASLIPLWAIGKPAKQLIEALGPRTENVAEDTISWSVVGVGVGRGRAKIIADVKNGKVTSLLVELVIDAKTQSDLGERITKLVGPHLALAKAGPCRSRCITPETYLTIGAGARDRLERIGRVEQIE